MYNTDEIMSEIIVSLQEKGYNPNQQLRAYLLVGDESYITRAGGAREKIKCLTKEQISNYLDKHK